MKDSFISFNEALSLIGNLLKDLAGKQIESTDFFLNCKGCRWNTFPHEHPERCRNCMRNYSDKYTSGNEKGE